MPFDYQTEPGPCSDDGTDLFEQVRFDQAAAQNGSRKPSGNPREPQADFRDGGRAAYCGDHFGNSHRPVGGAALPRQDGHRQQCNHLAGLHAEQAVLRHYAERGARVRATRWRGPGGEIDLILSEGETIVFVEVKKSRSHAHAAWRLSQRQIARILASAEAYLGTCPKGLLTDARFDVALVDARGQIDLIPNASMAA